MYFYGIFCDDANTSDTTASSVRVTGEKLEGVSRAVIQLLYWYLREDLRCTAEFRMHVRTRARTQTHTHTHFPIFHS